MKTGLYTVLAVFIGAALLLAAGPAQARAGFQAQGASFADIDAYVYSQMKAASIPGLAYAIVKEGQVVHMNAFGVAGPDGRPATPQTPFATGSIAKSWTALALQQLVRAGKLDLDAPVQRYLPWFRAADTEASAKITVRHLAQHQSGFSTAAGNNPLLLRGDPTAEEVVRRAARIPLAFEPGSRSEYCNLNYFTLGVVLESAAGEPFGQYVQENIFEPLGMHRSYIRDQEARQNGAAQGYRILFGFPTPFEEKLLPASAAEGGSTFSTAEDMGHFVAALANGGRYGDLSVLAPPGDAPKGEAYYDVYWFPMHRWELSPTTPALHGGANLTFVSQIYTLPLQHAGIVVLTNANTFQMWPEANSGQKIAIGALNQYAGIPSVPSAPGISRVYLVFDAVLLAVILGAALRLLQLRGWRERARGRSRARLAAPLILVDYLLPLLVLGLLPFLITSAGGAAETNPFLAWARLFWIAPDIGGVLFLAALCLLAAGMLKTAWLAGGKNRSSTSSQA